MRRLTVFLICITCSIYPGYVKDYEEVQDRCHLKILTPSLQSRKTAKIRLENGLEAYLISDPKSDQSAASLSMEVGSWNDDIQYPGIAHFLEHLLFMGSETYPKENAYNKQVRDNGGTLNAYTTPDRTVYSFSVNNDAFLTTLDMFSHMFVDPLFNPSGIQKEIYAVNQEHDKNIEHDGWRSCMIFKETGNQNHPNSLFSTGNIKTLEGIPPNKVKQWYQNHYSSDRAHLVLYSTLSIEELKEQTVRLFSPVPKSPFPLSYSKEKLFSERQEGSVIAIQPYKDLRSLTIEWELSPEYMRNLNNCAHSLIGYILGEKYASGLYAQLKNEGLIEDISSGMIRIGEKAGFFHVTFTLTPQGAEQFEDVIDRCFQTLNFLKTHGIPGYIFDEQKTMTTLNYEFQSRITPYNYAQNHAHDLIDEPLETYPLKTLLPTTIYNAKETEKFLKALTPESAVYVVIAPPELTEMYPDKKEKWTNAEYTTRKISAETLTKLKNIPPHPHIVLPKPNPFIPNDLKLIINQEEEEESHVTPRPLKLTQDERGVLYFWEDTQYHVPEISWILDIYTPLIDGTPRQTVLLDFFCRMLDERLAPTLSFAQAASLTAVCYPNDMKFSIRLNGYGEKALLLLNETLKELKKCKMTKEEFNLLLVSLKSSYANAGKSMPIHQALEIYGHLFFNNIPKHTEKLAVLQSLTYEDYLFFVDHLLEDCYIEALFAGNMTQKEAHQTWTTIHQKLKSNPYPKKNHKKKQMLTLSSFQKPFKISARTESFGNVAVLIIQEGTITFPKKASHSILGAAFQEDFFDTLRTKQQTAYIAQTVSGEEEEQLYNLFFVQSTTHQPDELTARFELFLETYIKDFETVLSEKRFQLIKNNIITLLETPSANLEQMANYLHTLAFKYKGNFERREKLIESLKKLNYKDFKKDAVTFFSRDNLKRVAILLEGKQPEGKDFRYEETTAETLKTEGTYISLP